MSDLSLTLQVAALHACIATRLQRSYMHELRDGLQGVQCGLEALTRAARSPETGAPDRAAAICKQAVAAHEQSVLKILRNVTLDAAPAERIDCGEAVRATARFLANDAAAHGVSLSFDCDPNVCATLRAANLRLILLGLAVDAIDESRSAELRFSCRKSGDGAVIGVALADRARPSPQTLSNAGGAWRPLLFPVASGLAAMDGGVLRCEARDGAWQAVDIAYAA
jgi:hypothetical protein